jgi:hypothetical protein
MGRRAQRIVSVIVVVALLVTGCATGGEGPSGFEVFARGLAALMLSPFMIVGGIAQGLGFLPYTVGVALTDMNRALLQAQAVSLDDSYKAAHGVSIDDPRVHPQTGEIRDGGGLYGRYRPEAIFEANRAFQRLLVSQGMSEERAQHYVLAGIYTHAWSRGHILLTVVYRHPGAQPFRVRAKTTGIVTTLRPTQRGWYEPYASDLDGRVIDEVIDWAGLEYRLLRQDKVVATLMALAAESVKQGRRQHDYWQAERRWLAGESPAVMRESLDRVRQALPAS